MGNDLMNSAMLTTLAIEAPTISVFFVFNLLSTLAVVAVCLLSFLKSNYVLTRLSFCFALFMCVFYQIPLVLFSAHVEASLQHAWFYSFIVNLGSIFVLLSHLLTRRFDVNNEFILTPPRQLKIYFTTLFIGILCVAVYLSEVPWECTGLYALLFDPWLTLLAREFGIKLIGSGLPTYLLGAYANSVAPILVLLSVWLIRDAFLQRRFFIGMYGVLGGFFAITAVLVSGIKGLLLPSMVMLVSGCYFWNKTWLSRIVTTFFSVVFVMLTLISFELMKERGSIVGEAYDFSACSVMAGTCQESLTLVKSLSARDNSLGLPSSFVIPLQSRLLCLCNGKGEADCPTPVLGEAKGWSKVSKVSKVSNLTLGTWGERFLTFANAVFYRISVVPFQVSVWHYMYAESESINGLKTLPFSNRLLGQSLNMPKLVYQKYASIYSGGDKTSTSSAPTSFFLAYPAYLGIGGFVLALALVIALDLFLAILTRSLFLSLLPLLIGGVLIMCMNFMTSDFITVLISHGGAFAILILLIHALLLSRRS